MTIGRALQCILQLSSSIFWWDTTGCLVVPERESHQALTRTAHSSIILLHAAVKRAWRLGHSGITTTGPWCLIYMRTAAELSKPCKPCKPPQPGCLKPMFPVCRAQATLAMDAQPGQKVGLLAKVSEEDEGTLLCALREGGTESQSLDLIFDSYTEFSVVGDAAIHLSGYYMIQEGGSLHVMCCPCMHAIQHASVTAGVSSTL